MIHFFGKEAFFTRGLLLTATLLVFSGLLHFVIVLEAPSSIYDVLVMWMQNDATRGKIDGTPTTDIAFPSWSVARCTRAGYIDISAMLLLLRPSFIDQDDSIIEKTNN
jgi:hypothetical protein